jgi:hypothetical protein
VFGEDFDFFEQVFEGEDLERSGGSVGEMFYTLGRGCPEVAIDDQKFHGEPNVGPYRVAARTVIESEELGESPSPPLHNVRAILSYYQALST